jgi:hypothetical protein
METLTLELTAPEAEALLKLIDLAVRGGGLSVANAALVLSNKIQEAAKPPSLMPKGNGQPVEATQ